MNKQQLASTIWQSANQMRSKIEANEYKDYILGFMFYKYLSDREISFLKGEKYSDEDIKKVTADDEKLVKHISENIGYFIAYEDLFSSWLSKGDDFDVSDVRDALSNFDANIEPTYKKLFENIFKTLQSGLSKLGETSTKQTKSIKALLKLIKRIPMDGKQDYDVLGFIYEYLISMFAANAGKKAGEFYTPHEVSVLMSEIVANHLKDREHIKIYDPTSGSGSLLINIGASMAQYIEGENKIDYYAQELKENTYNLTRMNLVMRGINPANINVRNGDTLEDDWPFFETDENKDETYSLVKVDAVVSNPPYSQKWDPKNKEFDPRFKEFGVAPKAKADYAFLLHELYHLEDDGIMTIVLPHGVLFRGGEEETIRKTLIERNHIEAIIGLPANIFFGTGIPTIIMVLKRTRSDSDILIIDASKNFEKVGKNNKLRARDIREIVDTLKARKSVTKFAKLVTKDDIRKNEYNLNIPRYVDSSDDEEPWDIHSIMFGGIPNMEIESLRKYWDAFPGLREEIFGNISDNYATVELLLRSNISKQRKKNLRKLMVYFSEVDFIDLYTVNWNVQYNRNNQTYRMLISICYLVVKGLLQTQANGHTKLMDFLDEQRMCRLYEKFILEYYRREFKNQITANASQIPWQLDDEENSMLPVMQSDIMLQRGEKVLIIDAKYYEHSTQVQFDKHTLHSGNLYQIFTYVKNKEYELREKDHTVSGMLLYAKTDEEIYPNNVYQMSGNQITVRTLDLNLPFDEIAGQLNTIAKTHFDL